MCVCVYIARPRRGPPPALLHLIPLLQGQPSSGRREWNGESQPGREGPGLGKIPRSGRSALPGSQGRGEAGPRLGSAQETTEGLLRLCLRCSSPQALLPRAPSEAAAPFPRSCRLAPDLPPTPRHPCHSTSLPRDPHPSTLNTCATHLPEAMLPESRGALGEPPARGCTAGKPGS